jgi:UDP-N-acetylmuramoylalanine--D-glutamate ligase
MIALRGKDVLVVGMERSGIASADLLVREGAQVTGTDLRPLSELPKAAEALDRLHATFEPQTAEAFTGRDLIVVSPGVPVDIPPLMEARGRGIPVIGEVELASFFLQGRIIGITGSNGKTTTTALCGHILRECGIAVQVGGNIGAPVTGLVETSRQDQWNVLELSSFQLETISSFRADIGVCLNVTPDHLDRHHDFETYAAAKERLFRTQRAGDYAVLNAEDETCRTCAAATAAESVWFSSASRPPSGAWLRDGWIWLDGDALISAGDIPIRGTHNLENTMAAALAARIAGAELPAVAAAIRTFKAVEHRLEFVRKVGGVEFYNDSKATNVDATLKALAAFPGNLWVILGGKDKGSDYTVLQEPLSAKAKGVLLIGAARPKIRSQLGEALPLYDSGTVDVAVRDACDRASPGDVVLLAPACASFDQFTSYEHRGRVFKQLVQALAEKS